MQLKTRKEEELVGVKKIRYEEEEENVGTKVRFKKIRRRAEKKKNICFKFCLATRIKKHHSHSKYS